MKRWKKLCAILLICVMTLSLLPLQAGAYSTGTAGQPNVLSLGDDSTGLVTEDGTLWMWGKNNYGKLGDGTTSGSHTPMRILKDVASVSLGGIGSAAIKTDGSLWLWGSNYIEGIYVESHRPTKMMEDVAAVSLGGSHTAVIKKDGTLWVWGSNEGGRLGDGTITSRTTPVKIMEDVISVSLGNFHSAAIKKDGSLWMWGHNSVGELGDGTTIDRHQPVKIMEDVAAVSLGAEHTAAIKKDGSLWMWGYDNSGQLGNGKNYYGYSCVPTKIMEDVKAVSLGNYHTAAIKKDGTLWTWGNDANGKLGDGSYRANDDYKPVKIMDDVVAVDLGEDHSAAIKKDGTLWVWGSNVDGQLGLGKDFGLVNVWSSLHVSTPTQLKGFKVKVPSTSDVVSGGPSSWAEKEVTEAIRLQLVPVSLQCGYTDPITRAEFCALAVALYENFMSKTISERATFSDTSDVNVQKMAGLGVVNGIGGGKFAPNNKLTREQAATMLARLASVMGVPLSEYAPTFADNGSLSAWAYGAVGQVQAAGIMGGVGNNKFSPAGNYTREQSILTMLRLFHYGENAVKVTLSLNGGNGTKVICCVSGNRITPPNNPEKEGYYFGGWFKDKACTKPWNFDKDTVSKALTLYAKWEPKTTVTDIAEVSQQVTKIDGKQVTLYTYTLLDAQGNKVNFVKLRDMAHLLNGTAAQFNVDWRDNAIRVEPNAPYTTPNGAEMTIPTVISAPIGTCITPVLTNGVAVPLEAFLVIDGTGGGNNYFKLEDIAKVAGFQVIWDADFKGLVITTKGN